MLTRPYPHANLKMLQSKFKAKVHFLNLKILRLMEIKQSSKLIQIKKEVANLHIQTNLRIDSCQIKAMVTQFYPRQQVLSMMVSSMTKMLRCTSTITIQVLVRMHFHRMHSNLITQVRLTCKGEQNSKSIDNIIRISKINCICGQVVQVIK